MNELADIFKTFSNETRLRILIILSQKALCVCEIQGILHKPQPQISKQLAILKELGLLSDEKKDKYVYYKLESNPIVQDVIAAILENQQYPQLKIDVEKCANSQIYREGKC